MTLDEAIQEFEFDCKIRHLSPKTIDNYRKQLRYFERFLGNEFSILLTLPALKVKLNQAIQLNWHKKSAARL